MPNTTTYTPTATLIGAVIVHLLIAGLVAGAGGVPRSIAHDIVQLLVAGPAGARADCRRIGEKSPEQGREGRTTFRRSQSGVPTGTGSGSAAAPRSGRSPTEWSPC